VYHGLLEKRFFQIFLSVITLGLSIIAFLFNKEKNILLLI